MVDARADVCPFCAEAIEPQPVLGDALRFACPACGRFQFSGTALLRLGELRDQGKRTRVLFAIHERNVGGEVPMLTDALLDAILARPLPSPHAQADNLLRLVGRWSPQPGRLADVRIERDYPKVGAETAEGLAFLLEELLARGLLGGRTHGDGGSVRLTLDGWRALEALGTTTSRLGFLAMPFGDERLERVSAAWVRAAARAGFDLRRVDGVERRGLIDDLIRADLRASRFAVVELTGSNRGAYFEAGFAEALGRPVFYVCEEAFFHRAPPCGQEAGVHFDANHQAVILWKEEELEKAEERLVAAIRNELPGAARARDEAEGAAR